MTCYEGCDTEGPHVHSPEHWVSVGHCPGPIADRPVDRHPLVKPPPLGVPVWCPGHAAKIRQSIAETPNYAELLVREYESDSLRWENEPGVIDGRRRSGSHFMAATITRTNDPTERVGKRGKKAAAPTASIDVESIDGIAQWLHAWSTIVAERLRLAGPVIDTVAGVPHIDGSITRGSAFLLAQLDAVLEDSDLIDLGLEAMRNAGQLTLRLRLDDPVTRLYAPCPQCDKLTLRRRNGASQVECGHCGAYWPEDDYRRLVAILLG